MARFLVHDLPLRTWNRDRVLTWIKEGASERLSWIKRKTPSFMSAQCAGHVCHAQTRTTRAEQFKLRQMAYSEKVDANAIVEQQKKVDDLRHDMLRELHPTLDPG